VKSHTGEAPSHISNNNIRSKNRQMTQNNFLINTNICNIFTLLKNKAALGEFLINNIVVIEENLRK
jgi:hypothetical protein